MPDITGFIIFGSKLHSEKLKIFLLVNILGNPLYPAKVVKTSDFDSDISYSRNIQSVCKACFVQLRALWRVT